MEKKAAADRTSYQPLYLTNLEGKRSGELTRKFKIVYSKELMVEEAFISCCCCCPIIVRTFAELYSIKMHAHKT